ncbi:hypothetical protein [Flavobacterium sp. LB2P6]|uniref:hypothetical protein n=1 Tax=Flavobacterium sp. LB2P6 TaxID=3401714 RepID=UPI003AAE8D0B
MSKYFTTSDGQEFYQEHDAKNHAKTLDDKTVNPPSIADEVEDIEVSEAKVETDEGSDEGSDEASKDDAPKDDAPKDEAPKEIKLSKMTKAQLIDFAVANELTIDEAATNAVIMESIEVQLTEKNQA